MKKIITLTILAILLLNISTIYGQDQKPRRWSFGGGLSANFAFASAESSNLTTPILVPDIGINAFGLISYRFNDKFSILTSPGLVSHKLETISDISFDSYYADIPLSFQWQFAKRWSVDAGISYMKLIGESYTDKDGKNVIPRIYSRYDVNFTNTYGVNFKMYKSIYLRVYGSNMLFSIFEIQGYDIETHAYTFNVPVKSSFIGISLFYKSK